MVDVAEHHRRLSAKRKAERHAVKATVPRPRCRQCDAVIEYPRQLASSKTWTRQFCSNACRQEAWRDRHGE
jgi:hypothetical protein